MTDLSELYNHLKTLTSQWHYLKSEINTLLDGKASSSHSHSDATTSASGFMSSTDKTKLNGIDTGANKTTVDNSLSGSSTNPVQNKVINTALGNKVDKVNGKGLSTEDYTTTEKTKLANIESEANKTTVDSELSSTSTNPLQNKAINTALGNKVDKVSGKGLSTEDYTTAEQTKLAGITESADAVSFTRDLTSGTKIGTITINGTDTDIYCNNDTNTTYTPASATPSADTANGAVGTSVKYAREDHKHPKSSLYAEASHTHAATGVTDSTAHTNLGTSANANQATINTAIDTKIGSLLSVELIEVVSTRPTASASTMNKLYMVPETTAGTEDVYEIFVTVKSGNNYSWEKVDTARIDLSGYATTSALNSGLSGKANSTHAHGNLTSAGAIGSAADKIVVTTANGVLTTSDMITEMNTVVEALIEYGGTI